LGLDLVEPHSGLGVARLHAVVLEQAGAAGAHVVGLDADRQLGLLGGQNVVVVAMRAVLVLLLKVAGRLGDRR